MYNPNSESVTYTTTARPPRATYLSPAAQARRNDQRRAWLLAWQRAHPQATSAEILAALDEWEAKHE